MCYTRRKIQGGVSALRESDDTNFLEPNGQSRNLNVYGLQTWTQELCNADSDNDGRTNGEELGDPNCLWSAGLSNCIIRSFKKICFSKFELDGLPHISQILK